MFFVSFVIASVFLAWSAYYVFDMERSRRQMRAQLREIAALKDEASRSSIELEEWAQHLAVQQAALAYAQEQFALAKVREAIHSPQ